MRRTLLIQFLLAPVLCIAGETLFFEPATPGETTLVSLSIEGDAVSGTRIWEVPDEHGKGVEFTGGISAHRSWALFKGNTATGDGKTPDDAETARAPDLDSPALLKKDPEGRWQMLHRGFPGDIGARDEVLGKFPRIPRVLLP